MTKLGNLRSKAGLTQRDVAKKMHVSESAVGKWERGETQIDYNTLIDLLIIYGITDVRTQRRFADEYLREGRKNHIAGSACNEGPSSCRQEPIFDELIDAWKEMTRARNAFIKASNHFDMLVKKSGVSDSQILDEILGK